MAFNESLLEPVDAPAQGFDPSKLEPLDSPAKGFDPSLLEPIDKISASDALKPQADEPWLETMTGPRSAANDLNVRPLEPAPGLLTRAGITPESIQKTMTPERYIKPGVRTSDVGYTDSELQPEGYAPPKPSGISPVMPLISAAKTVTGIADWMTSPSGGTQLAAAGVPGLNLVMAGKFAKDMIEGGYLSAKEVGEAAADGDWQKVSDGIVNYAANAYGVKQVAKHGIKTGKGYVEDFKNRNQVSQPVTETAPVSDSVTTDPLQPNPKTGEIIKPPEQSPEPRPQASSELQQTSTAPAEAQAGGVSSPVSVEIKRIAELTPSDFVKEVKSVQKETGVSMTQQSYALARKTTYVTLPELQKGEDAAIAALKTAKDARNEGMKAAKEAGVPADLDKLMAPEFAAQSQKQFFTEAIRYRKAMDAAKGITDPAKLKEIETEYGVGDLAPEEVATAEAPAATTEKPIGMGGARPEEVAPQGTALKNAVGELERVAHGLPEQYPTQRRSMAEAWLRADETLKNDPRAGEKLAGELKQNPERGMTDNDSALLLRHKVALENAKNEAASDTFKAETPTEKAEAQARFDGLSQELLDLLDAAKFRGSQWGREGRWRQALAFDDYSLETMKRDKKLSLDRDLTPEENAQIQKLHERITELETQLAGKEKSTKQTQRGKVMDETVAETGKRAKAKGVDRDLAGEETDAINHLKERFTEQGDLTGAGTTIKNLMELLYRKGHTERISLENAVHDILKKQVDSTIPLEEVQDLMSGYGKYTEPSKDPVKAGVREVQGQILQVKKMLDIVRQGFAKPTGFLRQQAGQVQRNLQKAVNELKKQYGIPQDSAKALQSALDTVKTRLRNRILDIKQELANKEKIISKRSPAPSDAETIKLRQELDELQRQRDEMFPKEPITPEEQLKRLEASADRQIKQLEQQIKSGRIFPESKQSPNLTSERLAAARAKIEALKQERDAMRETIQPTAEPEAVQLQQLLNRLRNREVEYKDRLAQGRFEPRARKEQPVSKEVLDARARVETAKRDFQKGLTLDKMKRRTVGQKIYAGTKEALNLPRAALTAFDVSAVLRQGGFIGFGHPIRASTSIIPMFKALASEKYALRTEQEILSRPNAGRYASSKLYLASFDEFRLSKQEEIMMSRFANVLPGVRPSNRAFMTFLNKLRADSFDAMTKSLESRGTKLQPNELEAVSSYINVATGRGDLGKAAAAAETMATVFFSPRNAISRFQLILGNPAYRGSARTRILVAKEYARFLGGLAVIYGLGTLAGAKVETDPRATDFGKLRFGNTRVDPLTGLSQATVLLSRVGSGEQKTGKGKIVPVRGDKVPYGSANSADLLARFARTKLAPTIGTTVNVLTGKNVVGQPVTPGSAAIDLMTPLSMRDIYDVMKEQGVTEGTAFGILSLFGMSVQNYEPMKPKK